MHVPLSASADHLRLPYEDFANVEDVVQLLQAITRPIQKPAQSDTRILQILTTHPIEQNPFQRWTNVHTAYQGGGPRKGYDTREVSEETLFSLTRMLESAEKSQGDVGAPLGSAACADVTSKLTMT